MNEIRLPQLRVLVTDYCESKCIYCRPSGEGNLDARHRNINYTTALRVAELYQSFGGKDLKITGGDPVLWPCVMDYVSALKNSLAFERVELITRNPAVLEFVDLLVSTHLDVLNFSLDTLSPLRYRQITGKNDFHAYINAITKCACVLFCKINMVILPDTSADEIDDMIDFCKRFGIRELKLLDYIYDMPARINFKKESQTPIFQLMYEKLDALSVSKKRIFQGSFGHPMNDFKVSENFHVICKDSSLGAWYVPQCLDCHHYPCHDAVMALRLTPYDSFQFCLINERMQWQFNDSNMKEIFSSVLALYRNAFFVESGLT